MSFGSVTFFRQKRFDGGIRTGISADGTLLLHRFDPGDLENENPALEWYVDITLSAEDIPENLDNLKSWLVQQQKSVSSVLREIGREFRAGTDFPELPFRYEKKLPDGLRISVSFSAVLRVDCLQMAQILENLADSWSDLVSQLDIYTPITS